MSEKLSAVSRARRHAAACLLGAIGASFLAGAARADALKVGIDNFTFTPARLVVPAGATVTWTNADDIPHTVNASDKSFRSKPLDTGDSFSTVFNKPGEYGYFCSLHPHMTGTIIVTAP